MEGFQEVLTSLLMGTDPTACSTITPIRALEGAPGMAVPLENRMQLLAQLVFLTE